MKKYYVQFYDDGTLRSYANGEYDFTQDGMEEISEELYNELPYLKKSDGVISIDYSSKISGEETNRLNILRNKRIPLLEAFDKWEKAVLRGRETDSVTVMDWYQNLLDLKAEAFDDIPERVRYYL